MGMHNKIIEGIMCGQMVVRHTGYSCEQSADDIFGTLRIMQTPLVQEDIL